MSGDAEGVVANKDRSVKKGREDKKRVDVGLYMLGRCMLERQECRTALPGFEDHFYPPTCGSLFPTNNDPHVKLFSLFKHSEQVKLIFAVRIVNVYPVPQATNEKRSLLLE